MYVLFQQEWEVDLGERTLADFVCVLADGSWGLVGDGGGKGKVMY